MNSLKLKHSKKVEPEGETDSKIDSDIIAENNIQPTEETPFIINAQKFTPLLSIPPRSFLYNKLYIKGFVTGTAATGGTGKTTIVDVETVSMAIGKDLLNSREPIRYGAMKILVLSLEDDEDEYQRRISAICTHYRLTDEELALLENIHTFFDARGSLKITRKEGNNAKIHEEGITAIKDEIRKNSIDVITIDPLISIHDSSENANEEMQVVIHALRDIARTTETAVHYLHHNRKGGGASSDDMRGGVSLKDGSRALRMLFKPAPEDLEKWGVSSEDIPYVIGERKGKSNFTAMNDKTTLYRTTGVPLHNGTDIFEGDFVGVAMRYKIPDTYEGITTEQIQDLHEKIRTMPVEERREDIRAKKWLGHAVMGELGVEKNRAKQMLFDWLNSGILTTDTESIKSGKNLEEKTVYTLSKTLDEKLSESDTE